PGRPVRPRRGRRPRARGGIAPRQLGGPVPARPRARPLGRARRGAPRGPGRARVRRERGAALRARRRARGPLRQPARRGALHPARRSHRPGRVGLAQARTGRPAMTPRALTAACVALAGLVAARPAAAHPLDIGYLRIRADGAALSITLDIHVNAAVRLLGRDAGAPGARALEGSAAELADATFRGAPITTRLGPCRWTTASAAVVDQTATLTGGAECPSSIDALHWAFPFVREA